ncbi:hypothetical protein [Streptomyces sp. NPDC059176]|uniref:hypothetical protein n=1 Tax=unclassified Streptomyces TaxID=2593676 RepID=UPI0036956523
MRAVSDARSPVRALRAVLFAAVCVTLAAVGHAMTAGHDLPLGALLLAFAVTAPAAWLAGARRRGAFAIGAVLLGVQGALHLIFAVSGTHGGAVGGHHGAGGARTGAPDPTDMTPMASDTVGAGTMAADSVSQATSATPALAAEVPTGAGFVDHHPMGGLLPSADTMTGEATHHLTQFAAGPGGMLAVHLLVALVCALWLARGEAAFFRLARTIGTLALAPLRLLLAVTIVPELPQQARPIRRTRPLHGVVLAHSVSRRGPPLGPVIRTTVPGAFA